MISDKKINKNKKKKKEQPPNYLNHYSLLGGWELHITTSDDLVFLIPSPNGFLNFI